MALVQDRHKQYHDVHLMYTQIVPCVSFLVIYITLRAPSLFSMEYLSKITDDIVLQPPTLVFHHHRIYIHTIIYTQPPLAKRMVKITEDGLVLTLDSDDDEVCMCVN